MPQRGKIKSKVVRSTIENKDVLEMFQGVLGTGEGTPLNLEIVYPKFQTVAARCERFFRLLEAVRDSTMIARDPAVAGELAAYVAALKGQAAESFAAPDLAASHPPSALEAAAGRLVHYEDVTREEYDAFARVYGGIKGCNVVNTIIVTCKNLVPHKKSLENPRELRDRFLVRSAGLTFAPLPDLPALNFKQLYISDEMSAADQKFLLLVLHKLYVISHEVYDAISAPDIDVDEFVEVIMSSLDDVKKQIPRCDEAFDKIRESVGLLKGNFGGYYKDYVASNNPTIIMENFVIDVSNGSKSSPKATAQFRRIIGYYRKLASQQAQHPKLQTLFQQVDKNFQELEKQSRDADDGAAPDSLSEDDEGGDARDETARDGAATGPATDPAAGPATDPAAGPATDSAAEKRRRRNKRRRENARWRKAEESLDAALAPPSTLSPREGPAGEGLAEEFARADTTPTDTAGDEGTAGTASPGGGSDGESSDGESSDGESSDGGSSDGGSSGGGSAVSEKLDSGDTGKGLATGLLGTLVAEEGERPDCVQSPDVVGVERNGQANNPGGACGNL